MKITDCVCTSGSFTFVLADMRAVLASVPAAAMDHTTVSITVRIGLDPPKQVQLRGSTITYASRNRTTGVLTVVKSSGHWIANPDDCVWVKLTIGGAEAEWSFTRWSRPVTHEDFANFIGYPLTVADGVGGRTDGAYRGDGDESDLQATVSRQLAVVLGGVPSTTNPRGVVAALKRSFSPNETDGVVTWDWTPRGYGGVTDTGASVTGAQASIVSFAKSATETMIPLISGLTALKPPEEVNPDEIDAARTALDTAWAQFVGELGADGGPRRPRAELLLGQARKRLVELGMLLGMVPVPLVTSKGQIDLDHAGDVDTAEDIRTTRKYVVLPDDEADLTNFIIVRDLVASVEALWAKYKQLVAGASDGDVGRGTVFLDRALAVVGELVVDVEAAMTSVFVGPDDRRSTTIMFTKNDPLTLDELLSWANGFASDEAPQDLQDSGRVALDLIMKTAAELKEYVRELTAILQAPPQSQTPRLPIGLYHPRVRKPLQQLEIALTEVSDKANKLDQIYT